MKIVLFVLVLASSSHQDIELQTSSVVRGSLGERVSLPCRIVGWYSVRALTVVWTKDQDVPVYTHRAGEGEAASGFQGRASLDQSQLDAGNVSLLLSDSSPLDEGNYTCQVGRASGRVELKLGGLGSRPQFLVDSFRSSRSLSLSCWSRGWHPNPVVSWTSSDGQTLTGAPLDDEEQGASVLKDVRDGVTLTVQSGLNVTCTMRNPVLQTQSEEVLTITGDFPPDVSPWLLAFWGVFPLVAMASGIIGYFFKRKRDSVKEKERQVREAEREPLMKQDEYAELKKELSAARAVSNSEWKRVLSKRTKIFSLTPGSEGPELSSGSHYWEVILRDVRRWTVGVKKEEAVLGRDSFPETGVWSFSYSPEKGYCAWLHPPFPITPSNQPKRVGILLDYSEGQLTLYDPGTKPAQRLYTFNAIFTTPVRPFYE
ncbi:butyrophilin subfamily 1 member A1-like [Conger conger]|uniref:butyrophilin subfamily 1 member A1-like n=1 Tax=Conger conger TaxID=82655 RepID=UPI002A59EC63|nr:butyrophilin subfamily 1 member A1-like [Conger conger]XP_061115002.1 butyrophilin subfamily 1 member A1-like [Conger conger]XP_061115003.1 butyrophilin subfamily 1 member A1-like [Conger conger]XP_061115004.1 butyrophilin subfamily 1 member A1-like [Conger conger]XP_061115005.1 butyrophilin subfamily 1 member A1-like [Conger conger]